jgi:hypothetical protein
MTEPSLPDKVVAIHAALTSAGIDHAFGGALSLAYYSEPRATSDVDVNVFVTLEEWPSVAAALDPLGVDSTMEVAALERDGWVRWHWGRNPVDLFFAYDELHDAMRADARRYPFANTTIPVLSPEHLVVCKVVFDRPKDWIDVEGLLAATPALAPEEVRRWLDRIVGADDQRRQHFDRLVGLIFGE